MGGRYSVRCEMCDTITNGWDVKGYMLCASCKGKYDYVPNYIPIGQWGKYARIEGRKKEMSLL